MKPKTYSTLIIITFFLSTVSLKAQVQQDTIKVKSKYEYAFLYLRMYKPQIIAEMIINYENGKQEDFKMQDSFTLVNIPLV